MWDQILTSPRVSTASKGTTKKKAIAKERRRPGMDMEGKNILVV